MSAGEDPLPPDELPARRRDGFRQRWVYRHPVTRLAYRLMVALVGLMVVGVGLLLVPLPGPGWLVVFLGLAILASEFAWAAGLLGYARGRVAAWTRWLRRQSFWVRILLVATTLLCAAGVLAAYAQLRGFPDWVPLA